jgi:SAM-dependent methyltransferase
VGVWVDGARYATGGRLRARTDSVWWTGPAPVAARALGGADGALVAVAERARRSLTDDERIADVRRVLEPAYLAAATPEGGSGFGGTPQDWFDARSVLCDAVDADATFLDVGCANGHLMASIVDWCAARPVRPVAVEPHGVDVSPALVELARRRLPRWADRLWVGDARTWCPPGGRRFDVVHVLLDAVLPRSRGELLAHLLAVAVAPGGRLLVSSYGPDTPAEAAVTALGHTVAGRTRPPTRGGRPRGAPSVWITRP